MIFFKFFFGKTKHFCFKIEVSFLTPEQLVPLKIWLLMLGGKSCHLKTIMHLFQTSEAGSTHTVAFRGRIDVEGTFWG